MRTVEDLKAALAAAGRDPDVVARAEETGAPRVDGMVLVRTLPDGRCETTAWERGREDFAQTWDSEQQAVEELAPRVLRGPTASAGTEEQQRATTARMQAKAADTLAQIRAAQRGKGDR